MCREDLYSLKRDLNGKLCLHCRHSARRVSFRQLLRPALKVQIHLFELYHKAILLDSENFLKTSSFNLINFGESEKKLNKLNEELEKAIK